MQDSGGGPSEGLSGSGGAPRGADEAGNTSVPQPPGPSAQVRWEAEAAYEWAPFALAAAPAAPSSEGSGGLGSGAVAGSPAGGDDGGGVAVAGSASLMICQVPGCAADLTQEAPYLRRHRVCREHVSCSSTIINGQPQRYCQQCGRFHPLAAFSGERRSCRAGLAKHNARRRNRGGGYTRHSRGASGGKGGAASGSGGARGTSGSSEVDAEEDDADMQESPPEGSGSRQPAGGAPASSGGAVIAGRAPRPPLAIRPPAGAPQRLSPPLPVGQPLLGAPLRPAGSMTVPPAVGMGPDALLPTSGAALTNSIMPLSMAAQQPVLPLGSSAMPLAAVPQGRLPGLSPPPSGPVASAESAQLHRMLQLNVAHVIERGCSSGAMAVRSLDPIQQLQFVDEIAVGLVASMRGMQLLTPGVQSVDAAAATHHHHQQQQQQHQMLVRQHLLQQQQQAVALQLQVQQQEVAAAAAALSGDGQAWTSRPLAWQGQTQGAAAAAPPPVPDEFDALIDTLLAGSTEQPSATVAPAAFPTCSSFTGSITGSMGNGGGEMALPQPQAERAPLRPFHDAAAAAAEAAGEQQPRAPSSTADIVAQLLGVPGRAEAPSSTPPNPDGLAPIAPQCYLSDAKLVRLSLKLHGMLPDELPPQLAQRLQQLVAADGATAVVQGAMRPGCVHLAIDVYAPAVTAAAEAAGGGDGSAAAADAAEASSERHLRDLLPAPALGRLLMAGCAGSGAAGWEGRIGRLCHAQIGVGWVTALHGGSGDHGGGGSGLEWAAAVGAPRLSAVVPCAVHSAGGAAARLLAIGTGVPGGSRPRLHVRSRGFYRPTPPPIPVGAAAAEPQEQERRQGFVLHLPSAALDPGLLLVEAERLPGDASQDGGPVATTPLYSNQLPVVVASDPHVVSELRQLEWALLGGGGGDERGGACSLLGPNDARQVLVDVGTLLEAEDIESALGTHPLEGSAPFRAAFRAAALRSLALACCCGWPGTAAAAMRALTASPLCVPELRSDSSGCSRDGVEGRRPQPDFWSACQEAAAVGAAAMRLAADPPLSLLHMAVASGSAEMVGALLSWLQDCSWSGSSSGSGGGVLASGDASAADPIDAADWDSDAASVSGAASEYAAAADAVGPPRPEPWLVEPAGGGMSAVHLAALSPDPAVPRSLLQGSLAACAAWISLPNAAGHTPAALASLLELRSRAATGADGAAAPAISEELSTLARARLATALMQQQKAAGAEMPSGSVVEVSSREWRVGDAEEEAEGGLWQQEKLEEKQEGEEEEGSCQAEPGSHVAGGLPHVRLRPAEASAVGSHSSGAPFPSTTYDGIPSPKKPAASEVAGPSGSEAAAEDPALYKRAPAPSTTTYDDIPSPKKGDASDGKERDAGGSSNAGAAPSGSGGSAAMAPPLPPPPRLPLAVAAAAMGTTGGRMCRMFECLSALLLFSLAIEFVMVPAPNSAGEWTPPSIAVASGGASALSGRASGGGLSLAPLAHRISHAAPLAALTGLVMLVMFVVGALTVAIDRARAARARAAPRGVYNAPFPAFADLRMERAFEQRNAAALAWRDAAVSAALVAVFACVPSAAAAAGAIPAAALKALRVTGAVLPTAALLADRTLYARHRSTVVFVSHTLLLLGGTHTLLAPAAAAAVHRTGRQLHPSWLGVGAAVALLAAQPARLSRTGYLVAWQALPPLVLLLGARGASEPAIRPLAQLGVLAGTMAAATATELSARRRFAAQARLVMAAE